jgi:N-acetylglutamate synthase-like GNAT family acetyltransferase
MDKILLTKPKISDVKTISDISWSDSHLAYRSVGLIKKSVQKGNVFVLKNTNTLIGWVETYQLTDNVWGISSLYITPAFRGQKLSNRLFSTAINHIKNAHIFAATSHEGIKRKLRRYGFKKIKLHSLPLSVLLCLVILRYINVKTVWKLFISAGNKLEYFYRI